MILLMEEIRPSPPGIYKTLYNVNSGILTIATGEQDFFPTALHKNRPFNRNLCRDMEVSKTHAFSGLHTFLIFFVCLFYSRLARREKGSMEFPAWSQGLVSNMFDFIHLRWKHFFQYVQMHSSEATAM